MMRDVHRAFGLFLALLAITAQLTLVAAVPVSTMLLADATRRYRLISWQGARNE